MPLKRYIVSILTTKWFSDVHSFAQKKEFQSFRVSIIQMVFDHAIYVFKLLNCECKYLIEMKDKLEKYRREFSDPAFWKKLQQYARQAGVKIVYTALLLFYAYKRKETPTWARSIVLGVLGYFLAPIDIIPDLTPIIGYTDDIGVLSFGLITIAAYVNKDVKGKARAQLTKWFGSYDDKDIQEVDEQL